MNNTASYGEICPESPRPDGVPMFHQVGKVEKFETNAWGIEGHRDYCRWCGALLDELSADERTYWFMTEGPWEPEVDQEDIDEFLEKTGFEPKPA